MPDLPGAYSPARPTRSSRRALQRSSRPPSRVPAVLGVLLVVVVIAVGVAVAVGAGSHHHGASPPVHSHDHRDDSQRAQDHHGLDGPPTTAPPQRSARGGHRDYAGRHLPGPELYLQR